MESNVWLKTLSFFGFGVEEEPERETAIKKKKKGQLLSFNSNSSPSAGEIVVFEMSSFDEVQVASDCLKMRQAVIVNLQNADRDLHRRVVDFLSGVVYALDGNLQKINEDIFLFTPIGVEVVAEKRQEKEDFFARSY